MKNKLFIATIALVVSVFCLVGYTSCKKTEVEPSIDLCSNVTCQNNGICYNGNCSCPLGFSGDVCEDKTNKLYLGQWRVEQEIASSNNHQTIGQTSTYNIDMIEVADKATHLRLKNFMGDASIDVLINIHHKIGAQVIDSVTIETDVLSVASDFVFKRYQPLQGTTKQIVKGEGSINSNGTIITGYFHLTSPHQTLGVLNERIDFTAHYID